MSRRPLVVLEALAVRDHPTGVARSIVELLQALAAEDRGCDFVVAATRAEPFAALADRPGWNVEVCREAAGGAWRRTLFLQRGLPALCGRWGAGVLHCLQFVAPRRCPCPTVATVHDLAWLSVPGSVPETRRLYYRLMVPPGLRAAARIAVNSGATAAELARHFAALGPRTRVTPFGTPAWAAALGRRGQEPVAGHFLFVGTLEPRKNLPRLLDAYESLLTDAGREAGGVPDLVLAGRRGWGAGDVDRRLARPLLRERVRVTGYVGDGELADLYRSALALVFPSLHEGFGLPVLEAMALGVPVLTSDRGALAEVAGDAAMLADPEDTAGLARSLRRMAADAELRARLARVGTERAEAWTWTAAAASTAAIYHELAASAAPK